MQNEKLINLLNDYINSFNNDLTQIKVIPLIEDDPSILLDINDDLIKQIFKGNEEKLEEIKFIKILIKGIFYSNLNFELTSEQKRLIQELISLSKIYIEDNLYEDEMIEEAKKLLKILTTTNTTLDIYADIDMEVINHIMAYQKLKPEAVNEILREILLTIESFQEEFPDINAENETTTGKRKQTIEETIIKKYDLGIASVKLEEIENIELFNELNNSQNIMERTKIRQKLVEGNLKLALSIFTDNFLLYSPKRNVEEILGDFGLFIVETISKYNPTESTMENLLKKEIKSFVKEEAKRLETPFSMSISEQHLGNIIMAKEEPKLDSIYTRTIYNAINPEEIQEDSAQEITDTELSVLDRLDMEYFFSKLDDTSNQIMTLRYILGKTQQEVAEQLKITQSQVSIKEREARKRLKAYLEQTRSFRK